MPNYRLLIIKDSPLFMRFNVSFIDPIRLAIPNTWRGQPLPLDGDLQMVIDRMKIPDQKQQR
ncbi:hypothetical protein [Nitrosovibrio sp. Nv4]|uniref:hypothetical protein n=1 Tax=Nitrosovibrio sp. Nv4 TaxID=1945880 RepID=UPI00117E98C2|nr:hypothetical protein [Nitrosovibrio sp. Nv4]